MIEKGRERKGEWVRERGRVVRGRDFKWLFFGVDTGGSVPITYLFPHILAPPFLCITYFFADNHFVGVISHFMAKLATFIYPYNPMRQTMIYFNLILFSSNRVEWGALNPDVFVGIRVSTHEKCICVRIMRMHNRPFFRRMYADYIPICDRFWMHKMRSHKIPHIRGSFSRISFPLIY